MIGKKKLPNLTGICSAQCMVLLVNGLRVLQWTEKVPVVNVLDTLLSPTAKKTQHALRSAFQSVQSKIPLLIFCEYDSELFYKNAWHAKNYTAECFVFFSKHFM